MRLERQAAWCEVENGAAVLAIANPPANTLGKQTRADLVELLSILARDVDVRVVILTGAGDKFFSAGADIHEEGELKTAADVRRFNQELDALHNGIYDCPKPVIGAINGYAMGGGFELMLACDFRYQALEARVAAAGVKMGLVASADTLPRLLGPARAKELLFTGRQIDGAEAERLGLANRAVPRAELMATVQAVAAEIAHMAPLSLIATKQIVHDTWLMPRDAARQLLRTHWRRLQQSEDHKEAIRAFKEKRSPEFMGR